MIPFLTGTVQYHILKIQNLGNISKSIKFPKNKSVGVQEHSGWENILSVAVSVVSNNCVANVITVNPKLKLMEWIKTSKYLKRKIFTWCLRPVMGANKIFVAGLLLTNPLSSTIN